MKFSLILCTLNREKEIICFFDSLLQQTYKNFEVILVDQNKDDRIKNILDKYSSLNIIYTNSTIGLSKGRNIGISMASGDILGFPDDDCFYPPELLECVKNFFKKNSYDILLGKTIDKNTKKIVAGRKVLKPQKITTFYTLGSSTTLFIKNTQDVYFDEQFGLGAIFNSEEENELIFRLLKMGYSGYYNPNINYVYHPAKNEAYTDFERIKARSVGLGAFIAKHIFSIEGLYYFFKYNILRPLCGGIFYLFKLNFIKSKFYFYKFIGIWNGFFRYLSQS